MPIRASVLRSPAANASTTFCPRLPRSAPRPRASPRARRRARARAADGRPWLRPRGPWQARGHRARPRRRRRCRSDRAVPPRSSAVWMAPTARTEGSGSRSVDSDASLTGRGPRRRARARVERPLPRGARARLEARAPSRPARSRRARAPAARQRRGPVEQASRSATTGRPSLSVRGARGRPPRSAGRRPSSTRRSITTRSRSGSIGGLVTWANAWRRWSSTGRSTRAAPGVGVSSPMLHSGS